MSNKKKDYSTIIGMPCRVYWAQDNDYYHGQVLDFRRQLRGHYDDESDLPSPRGRPKLKKEAEVVAKKAFFVKYEDGEQEWIEILKWAMESYEGDSLGRLVVEESKKLKHFWNAITKKMEAGDKYTPLPIEKRKAELTEEHRLKSSTQNVSGKQNASSSGGGGVRSEVAGEKKEGKKQMQKRKAIALEQAPEATKGRKVHRIEVKSESFNLNKVKAQIAENLKLKQRQEGRGMKMKPPGRRLGGGGEVQPVEAKPNMASTPYHMKAKFSSLERDLFNELGLPYAENSSALTKAITTLKSSGEHGNLRKICSAVSKAYAELSGGVGGNDRQGARMGEEGRASVRQSAAATTVGLAPSSGPPASVWAQQSLQSKLASAKHAQMLQNPFFKKRYNALVETFDAFSSKKINDKLDRSTLNDWRGYKAIFEKSDEYWQDKEKEIKQKFRNVI